MFKKYRKALLVFVAILFIFAGCNNKPVDENPTSSSTEEVQEAKEVEGGQRVTDVLYSENLKLDWNYTIYLPKDYDENKEGGYPVLYMLHGLGGNHTNLLERFDSIEILDEIIEKAGKDMLVVFPDGFNSFYINQNDGMQMEDAVMKDLVPFIDSYYNTNTDRSMRAIGGISMGGYGAARFTLKYPQTFSKALLISPAVWYKLPEDNPIKMNYHAFAKRDKSWSDEFYQSLHPSSYIENAEDVEFYIRTTSGDQTVDVEDVKKFASELDKASVKNEFIIDPDEFDHNWDYWKTIADDFYKWTLDAFYESKE